MLIVLDDELDVLREMRPVDRDVFNYLAARCDFESGVVGKVVRVSYGGIALELSEDNNVARRVKSTLVIWTRKQIINSVDRLVSAGLLERMSASKRGDNLLLRRVFFADFVTRGQSDQNPDGTQLVQQQAVKKLNNIINNSNLEGNKKSRRHAKINSVGTLSIQQHQQQQTMKEKQFSLDLAWKPDKSDLEMILYRAGGFKYDKVDPAWESEFVSYWWSHPEKTMTQKQWTAKLAAQLVSYFRNPGMFDRLHGGKAIENKKMQHYPIWAQIPKSDNDLVVWMQSNGYGDPPVGFDYHQLRQWLRSQVDRKLTEFKRGLS